MKNRYSAYYRPLAGEIKEAAETALLVFDTNCLLDILRISPELAEKTLDCIRKYKDRIYIPAHVDEEYHRHLFEVPAQVLAVVENKSGQFTFDKIEALVREQFKGGSTGCDYPSDCVDSYVDKFKKCFDRVRKEMEELRGYFEKNFNSHSRQIEISDLLQERILPGFTTTEIEEIKREGVERYAHRLPPGYKDAAKATATDDNNEYGDLIVWKEILRLAEGEQKHVFFVCRDIKEDWIARTAGKTLGPRIELIVEFKQVAPDCIFHIYTLTQFLRVFSDNFSERELDSFPEPVRTHTYYDLEPGDYLDTQKLIRKIIGRTNKKSASESPQDSKQSASPDVINDEAE